jgi:uncharacterized iron-regulated membrane protein
MDSQALPNPAFYRTVWRWHFYAGLLVLPVVTVLAATGLLYLFKPEIERWEERSYQNLPMNNAVSAQQQLDAVLAAFPDARFQDYRLPERAGDAAMITLKSAASEEIEVFVSPQGHILGSIAHESRIISVARRIHGQLLLGPRGSWLVETVASWTIVMVLSGVVLWWPRQGGLGGVLWPRLTQSTRVIWRDLHAVTGFWISGFVLVLLLSGLPWAGVWGEALKAVRADMGWVKGKQDWTIGGVTTAEHTDHVDHDHAAMLTDEIVTPITLTDIVAKAEAANLAFPVLISGPTKSPNGLAWAVKSDAQNRPLRTSIWYSASTGAEVARQSFSERHVIDRVIGYGIAWHEGHLFGWMNRVIGVVTALGLMLMTVGGAIMWVRRKPAHALGAPPWPRTKADLRWVAIVLIILAVALPLFTVTLVLTAILERVVIARIAPLANWLGLKPA